ncbi:MAG: sigma-54-dependent transcriptional regulator [Thermoanaerobaculales bacterium]
MARNKVLLVDDEESIRHAVGAFLGANGFEFVEADSIKSAEEKFAATNPDAVILDFRLPDGTALDLLPRFQDVDPEVPIVVLTAYGSIDLAVRTIHEGAAHFLTKPVEMPALLVILDRLLEQSRRRRRQIAQQPASALRAFDPFLGSSDLIRDLKKQAAVAAAFDDPVLISGEAGIGKGVLARWIHDHGSRQKEAVVHVNCAGITAPFLDAELSGFGWNLLPDTGAKRGLFEVANHGTLFLDEIGEVEAAVQSKLIRVLTFGTFRRLGEEEDRAVDVRLIATTNRQLAEAVEEGSFSSELYRCFDSRSMYIPALRERSSDIPLVAAALMERISLELGRPSVRLSEEAVQALASYRWPGNVRELHNVLERAVLLCADDVVRPRDLPVGGTARSDSTVTDTRLSLAELELRHISAVLSEEKGDIGRCAARLGVPNRVLRLKIKKLGLAVEG